MSSSNKRERELARAKRERQLARATSVKKNRTVFLPAILVLAIALIIGWNKWDASQTTAKPSNSTPTTDIWCAEAPTGSSAAASFKQPANMDLSKASYQWVLNTNCGQIVVELEHKKAPITVNSMLFLTQQKYFNQTPCHRVTTSGLYVLQCGDPTGTGAGGPGYKFKDENLPKQAENNYPAGTVAMANSGPGTNGSQFFIVYDDTTLGANYTIFGHVIRGLSIVERIAKQGAQNGTDGPPTQPIGITTARFTIEKDYSQTPTSQSASPTNSKG